MPSRAKPTPGQVSLLDVYAFHREATARDFGGMLMVLATTPPPQVTLDPHGHTWWNAAHAIAQAVHGDDFAAAYGRYLDAYRQVLVCHTIVEP